jgi:hypothetical protein
LRRSGRKRFGCADGADDVHGQCGEESVAGGLLVAVDAGVVDEDVEIAVCEMNIFNLV